MPSPNSKPSVLLNALPNYLAVLIMIINLIVFYNNAIIVVIRDIFGVEWASHAWDGVWVLDHPVARRRADQWVRQNWILVFWSPTHYCHQYLSLLFIYIFFFFSFSFFCCLLFSILFIGSFMRWLYITLKPGDRLNTHCVYNNLGNNNVTNFGFRSVDEMCSHTLLYYPKIVAPIMYLPFISFFIIIIFLLLNFDKWKIWLLWLRRPQSHSVRKWKQVCLFGI